MPPDKTLSRLKNVNAKRGVRLVKVKFGNVKISGPAPETRTIDRSIAQSTEALKVVVKKIIQPGVNLGRKKVGVPRFSVSENDPAIFIKEMDGHTTKGHMVNGEFVVID